MTSRRKVHRLNQGARVAWPSAIVMTGGERYSFHAIIDPVRRHVEAFEVRA